MYTWILLGVLAVALIAVVVRLVFGRSAKRNAPAIFENGHAQETDTLASAAMTQDASAVETSSQFIGDDASHSAQKSVASTNSDPATGSNRLTGTRSSLFSNFQGLVAPSFGDAAPPAPEDLPVSGDELVFGESTAALAQMLPESAPRKAKQRQDLAAAGYHSRGAWLNLNSTRFVMAFLGLVAAGMALIASPPELEIYFLAAVLAVPLVGWSLPPLFVASKANDRRADIERGLPDALDMMNMGVSQGLTVQASLKRIGPEIVPAYPALGQELAIVNQQARVGSLSQALKNFANRIESAEVSSFTSLLIQSESTGTSISQALSDYSDSMRSTIRERADARANAASFKLLFPTVLCLMPSVFMFLLSPAVVQLSDFTNNTANELLESRSNALNSLDQQPQLNLPNAR